MIDGTNEYPQKPSVKIETSRLSDLSDVSSALSRYIPEVRKEKEHLYADITILLNEARIILMRQHKFTHDELYGTVPDIQNKLTELLTVLQGKDEAMKNTIVELQDILKQKIEPFQFRRN